MFKKHSQPVGRCGWIEWNMNRIFVDNNSKSAGATVWLMSHLRWDKVGFYHGQPELTHRRIPFSGYDLLRVDINDGEFKWSGVYLFRAVPRTAWPGRRAIGQITSRFGLDRILWTCGLVIRD